MDQKIVKGIDGVYENPSPPPKYIIAAAKYNTSKLSNTKDGFQMIEDWILGSNRLEDAVGAEIAERIRDEMVLNPENIAGLLVRIDKNVNVTESVLDSFGKVVK
ncbi:cytosolic protein [Bacillus sp. JZ8]